MKKVLSLLLVVSMLLTFSGMAFAGSWQEHEANKGVKEYCQNSECGVECTGTFGCNCCTQCPNFLNERGEAVNLAGFASCHVDCYLDLDEKDAAGNIVHTGSQVTVYYWKALCCENCTGKSDCKCHCGCDHCVDPLADDGDLEGAIENAQDKAQNGFIKGISSALESLRKVMYDLFDRLFEFLRLEDLLGKGPSERV